MAHNRATALAMRTKLAARLGTATPCPDDMIGSLAAVTLPDAPMDAPRTLAYASALQTALVETHGIQVPIISWPKAPRRHVRISAQIYNEPADYDRLAEALAAELASER